MACVEGWVTACGAVGVAVGVAVGGALTRGARVAAASSAGT